MVIYRARISSSTDGGAWRTVSEGVMWPGLPISLYGETVPAEILQQLLDFDPIGHAGGTFYAQAGNIRYMLEALRAESFAGIQEWLNRHRIAISAVSAAGDRSVQIRVQVPNGRTPYLNLNWRFLGTNTAESASQWLEQSDLAARLIDGENVTVGPPNNQD